MLYNGHNNYYPQIMNFKNIILFYVPNYKYLINNNRLGTLKCHHIIVSIYFKTFINFIIYTYYI